MTEKQDPAFISINQKLNVNYQFKKDKVNARNNFTVGVKDLPKGAKPPATVDEGGLRLFLES